jgi:hypothetical protein
VENAPLQFQIPILLSIAYFDDTEMVQSARSALHQTFVELADHSQRWKLTPHDLQQGAIRIAHGRHAGGEDRHKLAR